MATSPTVAQALVDALRERGYRAELFPEDPPHTKVDAVTVWYDPSARYPSDTVWTPYGSDGWEWGRNFEHRAPTDIAIGELVDQVLATLQPSI